MKPKYWAITILSAGVVAVSLLYYIKQPTLDTGSVTVHHNADEFVTINSTIDSNGLKHYQNSQNGYNLSYPGNLSLDKAGPNFIRIYEIVKQDCSPGTMCISGFENDFVWVRVVDTGTSTLADAYKLDPLYKGDGVKVVQINNYTIDNKPAQKIIFCEPSGYHAKDCSDLFNPEYIVESNGKFYIISLVGKNSISDQILSSFKFTK
jgi:hypothetical protein